MIHVGTSGWQYDDWRGTFYPEGVGTARWLKLYVRRFPTVELNASFYRLPTAERFAVWREETPEGFVFAVKASRYITHIRRLRDCRDPVALLWQRAEELGPRLGPILFQLPPTLRLDLELLRRFLEVLPSGMRAAFEFRHPSWEAPVVQRLLDDGGAAFVLADRPYARVPEVVTGGWAYIRFHQGRTGAPGYLRPKLRRWAARIVELAADEIFVYFNNDTGGAAVRDAAALVELLPVDRVARTASDRLPGRS